MTDMSKQNIKVYRDLMGENEKWAAKTRALVAEKGIKLFNIIGSPGCGKTTLLEQLAGKLAGKVRFAVLEGDVETTRDAERLDALNVPVSQLLTGGSCHLEAKLVHHALLDLPLDELDMVIVENVGNLVCPAEFDVGEHAKVGVLSVTEGEDKPIKYPLLFSEAKVVVLTKIDLLPYVPFDIDSCEEFVRSVNGSAPIVRTSGLSGDGLEEFVGWLNESY
jgi:hydrogenase nickel incorporation protein HypB